MIEFVYRGRVTGVQDDGPLFVRVDLGFPTTIDERFRLCDIDAPEIHGVPAGSPERERGLAAKAFLEERVAANGGRVRLMSERRGKWRRWIATVTVPGQAMSFNHQLVRAGLADLRGTRPRPVRTQAGLTVRLDVELRTRLEDRAALIGVGPTDVIRTALIEYFARQEATPDGAPPPAADPAAPV